MFGADALLSGRSVDCKRIGFPVVVLVDGYVSYIVQYKGTLLEIHDGPAIYLNVWNVFLA
jgi:hypothetical protein